MNRYGVNRCVPSLFWKKKLFNLFDGQNRPYFHVLTRAAVHDGTHRFVKSRETRNNKLFLDEIII